MPRLSRATGAKADMNMLYVFIYAFVYKYIVGTCLWHTAHFACPHPPTWHIHIYLWKSRWLRQAFLPAMPPFLLPSFIEFQIRLNWPQSFAAFRLCSACRQVASRWRQSGEAGSEREKTLCIFIYVCVFVWVYGYVCWCVGVRLRQVTFKFIHLLDKFKCHLTSFNVGDWVERVPSCCYGCCCFFCCCPFFFQVKVQPTVRVFLYIYLLLILCNLFSFCICCWHFFTIFYTLPFNCFA